MNSFPPARQAPVGILNPCFGGDQFMPDCECLPECPFFNDRMAALTTVIEGIKKRLCRGDNGNCARYMIFKKLGPDKVPDDLYPYEIKRALDLLGKI